MDYPSWLIGTLLWELARYWQRLNPGSESLFAKLYSKNSELDALSAVLSGSESAIPEVFREAFSLAQGISADDYAQQFKAGASSSAFPALVSVLSRIRFKEDGGIAPAYLQLSDLGKGVACNGDEAIDPAALQAHMSAFMAEIGFLKQQKSHLKTNALLSLVEKYGSCLPVLGSPPQSDIPLSAVARIAAALVNCWHLMGADFPAVPDRKEKLYTLIHGDVSGIQKYIYRISSAKGVAKSLKGRSFEISLLTDQAVSYIMKRLQLTAANVIYNSGGSFMLLAPATVRWENDKQPTLQVTAALQQIFDEACYQRFQGEIFLGLGAADFSGEEFQAEQFPAVWELATRKCTEVKRQKFVNLISGNYDQVFLPRGTGREEKTCDMCQEEHSPGNPLKHYQDEENGSEYWLCRHCDHLKDAGRELSRAGYLAEVFAEKPNSNQLKSLRLKPLPLTDPSIAYYLIRKNRIESIPGDAVHYQSFAIPDLKSGFPLAGIIADEQSDLGYRFYGGNDLPLDENGDPAEYDELAENSTGLRRLGVLRMDVDNLGQVFRVGLSEYLGDEPLRRQLPPARMIGLSRLLDYFFSRKVSQLRGEAQYKDHISVVYSGGDDLFVVGSWDRVVKFASRIYEEFNAFVKNPHLTLSGGMSLVPKKFPIHKAADLAGQAEAAAKALPGKNGFTFLDKPLKWDHFSVAESICQALQEAIKPKQVSGEETDKALSKGILDRLRRIYGLYDKKRRTLRKWKKKEVPQINDHLEVLRYDKWRWMLVYSLSRMKANNKQSKDLIEQLQDGLIKNTWPGASGNGKLEKDLIEFIDVPTRWAEFLTRESDKED